MANIGDTQEKRGVRMNVQSEYGTQCETPDIEDRLAQQSRTIASRIRRPDVHPSYIVPVLSRALRILTLLQESETALNIDQIAKLTGTSKSTTYRIVRTLSAHGYLPFGGNGVYTLRKGITHSPLERAP